ncbi:MAG: hypothetical protein AAF678_03845 [Pseudomonadota bacterium]
MTLNDLPLQSLIWPDVDTSADPELYVSLSGGADLSADFREIRFENEGMARFDTAMNLFNLGKWQKYCAVSDLSLELEGQGQFEATILHANGKHTTEVLSRTTVDMNSDIVSVLSCDWADSLEDAGIVYLELRSVGSGFLRQAHWRTAQRPRRSPSLMLSITTFKREEAVRATLRRFRSFAESSLYAEFVQLTVVDNGQSLTAEETDKITVLSNPNYGGSGGFARGLMAAEERGVTHCVFMDDDAAIPFEAVERTVMFLAYATDETLAVNAALTQAERSWEIWENGARFDVFCRPAFQDTDLRDFSQILAMELGGNVEKPDNHYGGWWYFAFPVAQAQYMPFPFFVRGDDIAFSLMNRFRIVPVTGVICFQNEDFSAKESLRTIYLDLRSHVAHHLYAPQLNKTPSGAFKVPAFFFLRFFLSCHYETLAAANLSLRDVLAGPEVFAANLDMSEKFNAIERLSDREIWRPCDPEALAERMRINPDRMIDRVLMKLTLNGHLLPFFSKFGNHLVLPSSARGHRRAIWGAARITYVSSDGSKSYTVRHDKIRAAQQTGQFLVSMWRLLWRYRALLAAWKVQFPELTSREFWHDALK